MYYIHIIKAKQQRNKVDKMITYEIQEKQHVNDYRKGDLIQADNLTQAKRIATRNQVFYGTVLVILSNIGVELAVKENGIWSNT